MQNIALFFAAKVKSIIDFFTGSGGFSFKLILGGSPCQSFLSYLIPIVGYFPINISSSLIIYFALISSIPITFIDSISLNQYFPTSPP